MALDGVNGASYVYKVAHLPYQGASQLREVHFVCSAMAWPLIRVIHVYLVTLVPRSF